VFLFFFCFFLCQALARQRRRLRMRRLRLVALSRLSLLLLAVAAAWGGVAAGGGGAWGAGMALGCGGVGEAGAWLPWAWVRTPRWGYGGREGYNLGWIGIGWGQAGEPSVYLGRHWLVAPMIPVQRSLSVCVKKTLTPPFYILRCC
jgi:hypothetical protein